MVKKIAIHQPNFFPWLGYFDKIARSDKFILLDDVQFSKTAGTYSNRVKLLIANDAKWVTAAVDRTYSGYRNINEMMFSDRPNWRSKTLKTILSNYNKHPHFEEVMGGIEPLLMNGDNNLSAYNSKAILTIADKLNLGVDKIVLSSDLDHEGSSNELLCSLTKAVGGTTYLAGGGADGYQDETVFSDQGLVLEEQNFIHPVYPQKGSTEFIGGLSIIDLLMNVGWEGSELLIKAESPSN